MASRPYSTGIVNEAGNIHYAVWLSVIFDEEIILLSCSVFTGGLGSK